jgi:hypothetical protein
MIRDNVCKYVNVADGHVIVYEEWLLFYNSRTSVRPPSEVYARQFTLISEVLSRYGSRLPHPRFVVLWFPENDPENSK